MIEFGPKKDDEVTAWGFSIPLFRGPFAPRRVRREEKDLLRYMKELDGVIGIHPDEFGRGNYILFRSEYDAISGRNLLRHRGVTCGQNIIEVYVPKEYVPD